MGVSNLTIKKSSSIFVLVVLLFLMAFFLTLNTSHATTPLYVNGSSGNDSWDGTSPTFISGISGPMKTIQSGINAVDTSGTVNVADGTYAEHITISKSLIINGENSQNTIIDGTNSGRTIQISSGIVVYLNNLTVTRGNSSTIGGGIYSTGTLTLNNCIITKNSANSAGGGIFSGGTTTVNQCLISENNAPSGGGIYNNNKPLYLHNTEISENTASTAGGGIYTSYGSLIMDGCDVSENTGTSGGGLTIFNTVTTISNSYLSRNIGTQGGGIYLDNGALNLTNSRVDKNQATDGGALYINMAGVGKINITMCDIFMNNALANGGAIYTKYDVKMNFSRLVDNSAAKGTNIYNEAGFFNAENNWWGVNTTPPGITVNSGSVDANPWLILEVNGTPTTILTGTTSTITGNLNKNSDEIVVGNSTLHVPDGITFRFEANKGTIPLYSDCIAGVASATYTAPLYPTTAIVTVMVGSESAPVTIEIKSADIHVNPTTGNDTNPGTQSQPVRSISRALEMIYTGGIIHLSNGIYSESGLRIRQPLTLLGTDHYNTIIDGGRTDVVIDIGANNVLLDSIKIIGGAGINGGAIHTTGINVTVNNCVITENGAKYGGGIWNYGILNITNSIISQNTAIDGINNGNGGGIYNHGTMNLENSSVTENYANNAGGGIYSMWGILNIKNSAIMLNQARYGGGINSWDCESSWNFNRIVDNIATDGANIYIYDCLVNATDNWWGSNNGPEGIYIFIDGKINTTTWLIMETSVNPNTPATQSLALLNVSLNKNNEGYIVGNSTNHIPQNTIIELSATSGSISPILYLYNGEGIAYYTTPETVGDINITCNLDNQDVINTINVRLADIYVDWTHGNNANPGTAELPVRYIPRALELVAYNGIVHVIGDNEAGGVAGQIIITQPVTLIGVSTDPRHLELPPQISAGMVQGRVMMIAAGVNNVKLVNLWLTSGGLNEIYIDGSGLWNLGGSDEEPNQIINCIIQGNEGRDGSGILNSDSGVLEIINSEISYNYGHNGGGGGIMNTINSKMTLTNTTVAHNIISGDTKEVWGCGILNAGTMELKNVTITDNWFAHHYETKGGGIFNIGTLTVNNTIITNNKASEGAGLFNYDIGTGIINNSIITGNIADKIHGNGGGIYNNGYLTLHFSQITGNIAEYLWPDQHVSDLYNSGSTVSAENNWWGSNSPTTGVLGQIEGLVNYSPWLYMTLTANPAFILNGSTSQITASFNNAYDGITITTIDPANGHIPNGLNVVFSSDSLGSVSPLTNKTQNGLTTIFYTAGLMPGISVVNATLNNQVVETNVNIPGPTNVVNVNPVDGAVNVPINQVITVTFSEIIEAGSAYSNIRLKYPNGSGKPITTSINGNTLTITPNTNLSPFTMFTIYIPANAVTNKAGGALQSTYTSKFTTAIAITSVNPVNGTINVPVNKVITITFNEPIQAGSTYANIRLKYPNGSGKPITPSINGNTLTITPNTNLALGTTFTIYIPPNAIVNSAGATIATTYTSTFTTINSTLSVTGVNPANGAINVPVNQVITITFSEPITAGSAYNNIKLKYPYGSGKPINLSTSGNTLTITPKTNLAAGTMFTIYIPVNAIVTSAGGTLIATYTSRFTTIS